MRFYTTQHPLYCGIDLHARAMYVCILNQAGETLLHRNMKATPETLLTALAPYRPDIVVAVECMFTWYWLADLCAEEDIPFRASATAWAEGSAQTRCADTVAPSPATFPPPIAPARLRQELCMFDAAHASVGS